MANNAPSPHQQHLPQYVGYREVQAHLKVSRRTVERMVRSREFPQPVQLSPNRVGWRVETLTEWLNERSKDLVAHAVSKPEDLEPDQLEKQAIDLVVKSMELRTGQPVDAAGLGIHMTRALSEDEFRDAERREFAIYSERFSDFSQARSWFLAAWLFPALRPFMQGDDAMFQQLLDNPKQLEALGHRALHEDSWAELEAAWLAMSGDRNPN